MTAGKESNLRFRGWRDGHGGVRCAGDETW
ncbi:predicted protein [Sclerotinia sclerotiorum 1980 UF-70]|uniref:Uncharacterized protein n=1 Tax=Sclerotinia sclerotiorum (strain ATCC 18683 / 1980 / Ss-1) TaxID=665079 RepID=A7EU67_SCLS1|nr:predicted protein [Sclerotinia sclerotiorum 1980 UF-70]EDN93009.1 predicted protein [Sclerotinia sclerotiorum 1980 UF-70]